MGHLYTAQRYLVVQHGSTCTISTEISDFDFFFQSNVEYQSIKQSLLLELILCLIVQHGLGKVAGLEMAHFGGGRFDRPHIPEAETDAIHAAFVKSPQIECFQFNFYLLFDINIIKSTGIPCSGLTTTTVAEKAVGEAWETAGEAQSNQRILTPRLAVAMIMPMAILTMALVGRMVILAMIGPMAMGLAKVQGHHTTITTATTITVAKTQVPPASTMITRLLVPKQFQWPPRGNIATTVPSVCLVKRCSTFNFVVNENWLLCICMHRCAYTIYIIIVGICNNIVLFQAYAEHIIGLSHMRNRIAAEDSKVSRPNMKSFRQILLFLKNKALSKFGSLDIVFIILCIFLVHSCLFHSECE